MKSIWKDTAKLPAREPLKGELHTDVLIIGGGMAGILCAYMLKQKGVDCVVAERSTVGGGVTGNTTAKITSQHGFLYEKLTKRFGSEKAGLYLQANQEAVKAYQKLCQGIDCDFEEKPAFAYAAEDEKMLWKEQEALERLDFPAWHVFYEIVSVPFLCDGSGGSRGCGRNVYRAGKGYPFFAKLRKLSSDRGHRPSRRKKGGRIFKAGTGKKEILSGSQGKIPLFSPGLYPFG